MRFLRVFCGAKLQKIYLNFALRCCFALLTSKEYVARGSFFINIEIYFKKMAQIGQSMDIVRIFVINDVKCVSTS